jgi:uncharacterized Ntn-hydrolase superfamily protein
MRKGCLVLTSLAIAGILVIVTPQFEREPLVATFSIVGFDPETGDLGVAVASKFPGVGAVVPYAEAGVGAVATQSLANVSYGPNGMALLKMGLSPQQVVEALTSVDDQREMRQWGIVDAQGRSASFTGKECFTWAGHRTGPSYAAQGNLLVGEETVSAMEKTFLETKGLLPDRLLAALDAGQAAGGDRRGRQSAALLVVRKGGGYGGLNDRFVDLQVYDHADPVAELKRLYALHRLYFFRSDAKNLIKIEGALARELKQFLAGAGYYEGPVDESFGEDAVKALADWMYWENYDERVRSDGLIDREILEIIRSQSAAKQP